MNEFISVWKLLHIMSSSHLLLLSLGIAWMKIINIYIEIIIVIIIQWSCFVVDEKLKANLI